MLHDVLYWLRRLANPPLFVVTFSRHGASCARGKLTGSHLAACSAVADEFGLTAGHVDGRMFAGRLVLTFSPAIPAACHQRLRNVLGTR